MSLPKYSVWYRACSIPDGRCITGWYSTFAADELDECDQHIEECTKYTQESWYFKQNPIKNEYVIVQNILVAKNDIQSTERIITL